MNRPQYILDTTFLISCTTVWRPEQNHGGIAVESIPRLCQIHSRIIAPSNVEPVCFLHFDFVLVH